MPRVDHHAALRSLRSGYLACRKLLAADPENEELLERLQEFIVSTSPSTLSCESVQRLVGFLLSRLGHTRINGEYHRVLTAYLYANAVPVGEALGNELFTRA